MRKKRLNISSLFLLLVFLAGTVGINVNKTYCKRCHVYLWQFFLVSFEEGGSALQFCNCCHSCKEGKASSCENADKEHSYYQVDNNYFAVNHHFEFTDLGVVNVMQLTAVDYPAVIVNHFILSDGYMDTSPPCEVLCTFRC